MMQVKFESDLVSLSSIMKKSLFFAVLLALLSFVACDKDKPSPSKPDVPETPTVIPEADLKLVMDRTTKVLYYGDRKTEGSGVKPCV